MKLTGAQIMAEVLIEQGADTVFGYPGGAILNVYDALYEYKDQITHVLTSHEQGASHAADGYARATGKVGVCLATSGPGATNLVTGIATAYMDSIPVVAITCNVGVSLLGKDSFQEIDIAGITTPITKHNFIVKDIEKLYELDMVDTLDDKLKEVIEYRMKYKESSLSELANIISSETGVEITKSGLNHRFRKIKEILENYLKEKEKSK